MKTIEITIKGMSCNHCAMAVDREINKLPGVLTTKVQVGKATIDFDDSKLDRKQIEEAIRNAGYQPVE